jgi:LacI family transcriptional regulator
MTTMREVAAAAGVSAKTVSRVFNDDPHVTAETRARVEEALRKLNYVPNAVATTFRTGRSPVIGIAVPDIVDPFFAAIAKSVGRLATQHGMSTVVTSLGEDLQEEADVVGRLLSQSLSGLIIAPVAAEHAYLEPWKVRLPIVFVDRRPVRLAADSFTEDDQGGAQQRGAQGEQPAREIGAGEAVGHAVQVARGVDDDR